MGELWEVNTYNQPGVEQGKIYAKALLGNPDYKDIKEKLDQIESLNYEI
jgi:glucose-6-phosphate isomerase